MATIDSNIPLGVRPVQIESPLNSLAQIAQLQGAQQQNQLLQMKMDHERRTLEDQTTLRNSLSAPGADPYKVLMGRGMVTEANAYQTGQRTAAKAKSEASAANLKLYKDSLGVLAANPSLETAEALLTDLERQTGENLSTYRKVFQSTGGDPAKIREITMRVGVELDKQLPSFSDRNTGATTDTLRRDPITGQAAVVNTIANTQSPDNAASNARAAADAAAGRAVTMRGQNLTDARSRESNAANMSKPFEVTGPDGAAVLVQQDRQGNITPVQGYAPRGGGKPLPGAALKSITEVRDTANTIDRLASSFKPEYAEKGVMGLGAEASLAAKGVLGSDQDAVEWWKNYRKQAELVERHAMFGAALTPGEQGSWRSADIGPGMSKDVIKTNLETRRKLTAKMLDTTRQDLIDAGHSEQRVNAIAGRGPKPADATPAPAGGPAKINSDAEYNALPKGAVFVGPDGKQRRKP